MGGADLGGRLMEVRLGLSQIHIFRCSYDADGDIASDCVEEEGVEQLAILHEEVQVQPEGVSQHDFGEFAYAIAGLRGEGGPWGLSNDLVAGYQSSEQFEVVVVGAFLALLLEGEVLVKHETHEFVLPVANYDHIDLLGYYLVLHQVIINTHPRLFRNRTVIVAFSSLCYYISFISHDSSEAQHQDILYLMQKVSAKDEERFNKAVQIYSKKYRLNISSLIKFIEEKIAVSPETKNIILAEIVSSKNPEDSISKEQLKMYLHLVAAAQSKVDIRGKKLQSFHQFYRLAFNESKSKEEGKPLPDTKTQRKEVISQKKKEGERNDQQTKKEKATEQPPQNNAQPAYKSRSSRSSTSSPVKQKLQVIEEDVIDQNRTSNVGFRTENTQVLMLKMPDAQMMSLQLEKSARITGFDKFGQNYLNPIIKYHITFGEHSVYRRYSEFQRLMNDLSRRYEGFILPELPPKEGIKSNLSYFWGVDEAFLNDRQVKLEEMLNILLSSKFVSKDDILEKFLKEQDFQIEASSQGGLISYLKPITSIALNTKELKNYGVAYYNYLKEFNRAEINTSVTVKYKEVQSLLSQCLAIDHYRNAINTNFEKRRDVFKELKMDQNDRSLAITKFDKLSSSSASEIKNLSKEISKYLELKSQESWLNYLVREKESQSEGDIEELRGSKEEIAARIATMEGNLLTSIQELRKEKVGYLQIVADKMIEWRKAIHP